MLNLKICNKTIHQIDGFYNLNDLHKASGSEKRHLPYQYLRLAQAKELITVINNEKLNYADQRNLMNSFDFKSNDAVKVIAGRNGGTYVCKEIVYAYAMWVSARFNLLVIREFDKINTLHTTNQSISRDSSRTRILTTIENGIVQSKDITGSDFVIIKRSELKKYLDEISGAMHAASATSSIAKLKILNN